MPKFQPLTGIYEPSAIQQLPDGRFLIVEDEKQHPFSLATIGLDGKVSSTPLQPEPGKDGAGFWKLGDLEGVTLDSSGHIYAITSHSRDREGDEKKSREKLVRLRIDGDHAVDVAVCGGLKAALVATHPILSRAAAARVDTRGDSFNIEALEISPDQQHLLLGFRNPLLDGKAIIASIENVSALFDDDAAPNIAPALHTLDLDGQGIRGMCYSHLLHGYLVIGGPTDRKAGQFQLWFWEGRHGSVARRVTIAGLQDVAHAEGVCAAVINGQQRIVIVSDNGSRDDGRYGHFLLLDPMQLQIAPKA